MLPSYKYKAIDENGKIVESTITAVSKDEVMQNLRSKSQMPISIVENKDVSSYFSVAAFSKVKTKDIAVFCRQFYTMNRAGVPIITCLDTIMQQTTNRKFQLALEEVYTQLSGGISFSESLKSHPDVFPELLINMAEAGDATGNLDTVMLRMSTHYEKENKINSKVKGAMIYPIVLSLLAIVVVIFLLTFVMPTFVEMFKSSGVALPLPTRILLGMSEGLQKYWHFILLGVIAVGFLLRMFFTSLDGRNFMDKIKLELPLIGDLNIKIITSRFTRTLATLLSSGIPLITALEIVAKIVSNKVVEKGLLKAADSVSKGSDLALPIRSIGYFPPMLKSMIKIGEDSGMLDELLDQTANYYDEEVETTIQTLLTILEPIMIIIMALALGGIVIAILLPMFDMFSAIQGSI